jgi:hypothetical protein
MIRPMISIAIALGVWLGVASTAQAAVPCSKLFCTCDTSCKAQCTIGTSTVTCKTFGRCSTYHPTGCLMGASGASNPLACAGSADQRRGQSGPMCRPGGDDDAQDPGAAPAPAAPKRRG